MLVRNWRFVTIMLAALTMGMALCHLLEMPAKMTYDGALWLTLLLTGRVRINRWGKRRPMSCIELGWAAVR